MSDTTTDTPATAEPIIQQTLDARDVALRETYSKPAGEELLRQRDSRAALWATKPEMCQTEPFA